jgi:predicted dienelactone hydrolase
VKKHIKIIFALFIIILLFASCEFKNEGREKNDIAKINYAVQFDTLTLFDSVRNRAIPIAVYAPKVGNLKGLPIVILNHGYNYNESGAYLAYSYLGETLATHGYFVVSIEHDLVTDDLLVLEGKPQLARLPSWQRGSDNIYRVLEELKSRYPNLKYEDVGLIGHSNGGDMAVLFAHQHPKLIARVITLDHRRMPFPNNKSLKMYSLRSNDQIADEGVLPTETDSLMVTIVSLKNTKHGEMSDSGTEEQKKEITDFVVQFLKD